MAFTNSSLKIQNIVATTSLGKDVPLTKLAKTIPNTEYNPEQFPGLVLRIKKPKSAVLVFSSGNLVCTGTKSIAQVKEVIDQVIKTLRKINVKVTDKPKVTVQNIVASGTINMMLNLNFLSLDFKRSNITTPSYGSRIPRAALICCQSSCAISTTGCIARIEGGTSCNEGVRPGFSAVIGKNIQQRIQNSRS